MILIYTFLLLLLGAVSFLIGRRVAALERKYAQLAGSAETLMQVPVFKEGNSNRKDFGQSAKRYYLLGQAIQKRDRLEAKHEAWQRVHEKFSGVVTALKDWKGKKLPYSFGVLDFSILLYAIDYLGVGEYVSARTLLHTLMSLIATG